MAKGKGDNPDSKMAARMKRNEIERKTQICPACYRTISREISNGRSVNVRYTHICRGQYFRGQFILASRGNGEIGNTRET